LKVECLEIALNKVQIVLGIPAITIPSNDRAGQHIVLEHVVQTNGHGAHSENQPQPQGQGKDKDKPDGG
jgi:hypothetical protein